MRYKEPTIHYIPAQPGWTVAIPVGCDYDEETAGIDGIHIEPIICWQIVTQVSDEHDRNMNNRNTILTWTNPVTAHLAYACAEEIVIGKPDGTFSEPENHDFENADELLAEWRQRERRKRSQAS